jgi:hypothetical protein
MITLQKIALQPVQNRIESTWGKHAMSKLQIQAVAKRALQYIRIKQEYSYAKIKAKILSGDLTHLHLAVDRLIKSGATPWKRKLSPKTPLESLIFSHIKGNSPVLKDLLANKTLLKSIFLSPDPKLMQEVRSAIQNIYCDIWGSIQENPPQSKMEHFHYELLIGDLASFFAYQNANQDETLAMPVRVNGTWQMASYQIDKIKLTPSWLGSPIVAFGFKPKTEGAPPLLVFKGTTRPADDGSSLSILTDINPGGSVGAFAFHLGKKKIQKWLEANTGAHKAIAFGTSLGGAHAWRCALHFPGMIQEAKAYCPPGFSFADLLRLKKIQKLPSKPKIRMFCQYNDAVPYIDFPALKGVKYYEVLGGKIKKGVSAHTALYSLQDKSAILRMDPQVIKSPWKRAALTIARIAMTVICFLPFMLIHLIQTGIRRMVELCQKKEGGERGREEFSF